MPEEITIGGTPAKIERHGIGSSVEIVNSPTTAATFYVDGITGVSMSPHVTKIQFVEHFPVEGAMKGRFVMTMVIANDQLVKIVQNLNEALAQIKILQEKDQLAEGK